MSSGTQTIQNQPSSKWSKNILINHNDLLIDFNYMKATILKAQRVGPQQKSKSHHLFSTNSSENYKNNISWKAQWIIKHIRSNEIKMAYMWKNKLHVQGIELNNWSVSNTHLNTEYITQQVSQEIIKSNIIVTIISE